MQPSIKAGITRVYVMWRGANDVSVELLKEGGDSAVDRIHRIRTALWEDGESRRLEKYYLNSSSKER